MFFSTRSNLHFPHPDNPKGPDRVVIRVGTQVPDTLLKDPALKKQLLEKGLIQEYDVFPETPSTKGSAETVSDGYWNFDPTGLKGLNLDQLNMLIQQHAEKSKLAKPAPQASLEEALLFLTRDWKSPTPPKPEK